MRYSGVLLLLFFMNPGCHSDSSTSVTTNKQPADQTQTESSRPSAKGTESQKNDLTSEGNQELIGSNTDDDITQHSTPILLGTGAPFDPPITDLEINQILQQSLEIMLTDNDLQHVRDFYGTPGDREIVLIHDTDAPWPENFHPKVKGFSIRYAKEITGAGESNRVLGIRIDKKDFTKPISGVFDGNLKFGMSNVGGTMNGAVNGGCLVFFCIQRKDETSVPVLHWIFDP